MHVSTAYCHCGEPVLEEKYYPVDTSPEEMIKIIDETPDEVLEAMTPKILGDQPNTYAFSKALSEELVNKCGLPAAIARPSIGKVDLPIRQPIFLGRSRGIRLYLGRFARIARGVMCGALPSHNQL